MKVLYNVQFSIFLIILNFVFISCDPITTGSIKYIEPPEPVKFHEFENNTYIKLFRERSHTCIPAERISVDGWHPGTYSEPGDWGDAQLPQQLVDSYYVHFDTVGTQVVQLEGSIQFHCPIVGIMATSSKLSQSDEFLASPTTSYPSSGSLRGLEMDTIDEVVWESGGEVIRLELDVGNPADQIRILTAAQLESEECSIPQEPSDSLSKGNQVYDQLRIKNILFSSIMMILFIFLM
eukprot:gb/GECH01003144.1/.p1 GENE.gb/GECH01003144.1/~~gb/GECH01003144.1/.p1  ORF type:complete len:236 (+),score=37.38 gb/GECH01003144.1/:1-708(+)